MGLVQILARGNDESAQRFEDAIYDMKESVMEICEIYEEMKMQYGERGDYGERSSYRHSERMGNRGGSMGERRGRDSRGRYM